jgi:hypothetical protein
VEGKRNDKALVFATQCMNRILSQIATGGLLLLALVATAGAAPMYYNYKPGEFLVINGGDSPDKRFSIVSGKNNAGEFGVYLMDAQTKKVLGQLEEVETSWDTAPEAYGAHWSPDSKHIGITSKGDRRWAVNVIYRIENRRAYLVETPKLLCHAVPDFCRLTKELGGAPAEYDLQTENGVGMPWKARQMSGYSWIVKWISPTRFMVSEEADFQVKDRDPAGSVGDYGEVEKFAREIDDPQHPDDLRNNDLYQLSFKAEGECELLPGDKSRVVNTRPVKEEEEKK